MLIEERKGLVIVNLSILYLHPFLLFSRLYNATYKPMHNMVSQLLNSANISVCLIFRDRWTVFKNNQDLPNQRKNITRQVVK